MSAARGGQNGAMNGPRLSPEDRERGNEFQREAYASEAPRYDRSIAFAERWCFGSQHRGWACSQATGATLEVAIGTARNLEHYPQDVALTGIDLSPEMLDLARRRAADLGRPVTLRQGDAQDLPFPDATFDSIVCTYALCSVPDEVRTIAEMERVLRPGGLLILVDHIRSSVPPVLWIQRLLELSPKRIERELTRRPLLDVRAAGLEVLRSDRSRLGMIERLVARKASAEGG
jgi:ubiquinone/menaquinone biosynthesis C-methylase UbiE